MGIAITRIADQQPQFTALDEKIKALAHRLGVKPNDDKQPIAWAWVTSDGEYYEIVDMINAVLDRLEGAAKC